MYPYEPEASLDSLQSEHEREFSEEKEQEEEEEEQPTNTTPTSPHAPEQVDPRNNEPGLVSMLSNYVWSFFGPVAPSPPPPQPPPPPQQLSDASTKDTPPVNIDTAKKDPDPLFTQTEWTASPTEMTTDAFVVPLPLRRPSIISKGPFPYGEISPQRFASLNELGRKSSLSTSFSASVQIPTSEPPPRRQSDPLTPSFSSDDILPDLYTDSPPSSSPKSPRSRSITSSPESSRRRPLKTPIVSHSLPASSIRRSSVFDPSLPTHSNSIAFGSPMSSLDHLPQMNLVGRNPDVEVVMTEAIGDLLREHLPPRIRLAESWKLEYSLDQHGISIATLYQNVKGKGPLILAVRDNSSQVFGAYLSEPLIPRSGYYGTGECFLWRVIPVSERNKSVQVRAYPWTGKNDYFIASEMSYIGIGGGDGKFGLWISSEFNIGSSATCPTFENEPLAGPEYGGEFECVELEVWCFKL